jgi:DNA-binding transcriptional regulator YiaG
MSKLTRHSKGAVRSHRGQFDSASLSPRVRVMVGELHKLCDAVEGGLSLDEAARVRTSPIDLTLPVVSPDDVRAVRESLGMNKAIFAEFLGVGQSTLRRWERGQVVPSALARRFLREVRDDPGYWRKKLSRQGR